MQRIVQLVSRQLDASGVAQPAQWQAYRAFVLGYVDALAGLQARNGGHGVDGPESRALSASVVRALCGTAAPADSLVDELGDPAARSREEFVHGHWSALHDYDHWSEREMSSIENFITAAHERLLRLVRRPATSP